MSARLRRLLSTIGASLLLTTLVVATPATAEPTDTTAPVLRSISVPAGPYVPGEQITWTLDIVEATDIASVQIEYRGSGRDSGSFHVGMAPSLGWRTGQLTWTIPETPTTAPRNGQYETTAVFLTDRAGNYARYYTDGVLDARPPAGSSAHSIDVRALLSIAQSPRESVPPVLTAFTLPGTATTTELTVHYAVTDPALRNLSVYGRANGGVEEIVGWADSPPSEGAIKLPLAPLGTLEITRVVVTDAAGNSATYLRNGTFTTFPSGGLPPRPHALGLDRPVTVLPSSATDMSARARSGQVTLTWVQDWRAGHRITVSPGGATVVGGPTSQVATRKVTLPLQNGVTHILTITPTTPQGDGPSVSISATPRMSINVFGAGDRSGDGRADLWATGFGDATSDVRWPLYTGAGGGAFGRTLRPMSPYGVNTGHPGSTTGRGPGAPTGSLYVNGDELRQPQPSGGDTTLGRGFQVFRTIDASSDLTSDGVADLIGITPAGDFYLYTASSAGSIGRGVRLGGGWGSFHAVFSPGDFSGDGRADVVGIDSSGRLWLYPGTGRGGFGVRSQIGTGWGSFGSVFAMRDFSGDGRVDLGAITMDGRLFMYPGNGRSSFLAKRQIGTGWSMFL